MDTWRYGRLTSVELEIRLHKSNQLMIHPRIIPNQEMAQLYFKTRANFMTIMKY